MDALEQIQIAYRIDQLLERLALAVPDETLKKTITTLRGEWQDLAYLLTRLACGIEANGASGSVKKKAPRKRVEGAGDGGELTADSPRSPDGGSASCLTTS